VFIGSDHHLPGFFPRGRVQGKGGGSASMHQGTVDSFLDQDLGSKVQGRTFGDGTQIEFHACSGQAHAARIWVEADSFHINQ